MQALAPVEEHKSKQQNCAQLDASGPYRSAALETKEFEIQWLHESELSFANEAKDTKVKTIRSCHLRKADEKSTKQQKLF
jgi:hypothetical protein